MEEEPMEEPMASSVIQPGMNPTNCYVDLQYVDQAVLSNKLGSAFDLLDQSTIHAERTLLAQRGHLEETTPDDIVRALHVTSAKKFKRKDQSHTGQPGHSARAFTTLTSAGGCVGDENWSYPTTVQRHEFNKSSDQANAVQPDRSAAAIEAADCIPVYCQRSSCVLSSQSDPTLSLSKLIDASNNSAVDQYTVPSNVENSSKKSSISPVEYSSAEEAFGIKTEKNTSTAAGRKVQSMGHRVNGNSDNVMKMSVIDVNRRPSSLQEAIGMYIDFLINDNEIKTRISDCILPSPQPPLDFQHEEYYRDVMCRPVNFPTARFREWLKVYNVDIEITDPDGMPVSQTTFFPAVGFPADSVSQQSMQAVRQSTVASRVHGTPINGGLAAVPRRRGPKVRNSGVVSKPVDQLPLMHDVSHPLHVECSAQNLFTSSSELDKPNSGDLLLLQSLSSSYDMAEIPHNAVDASARIYPEIISQQQQGFISCESELLVIEDGMGQYHEVQLDMTTAPHLMSHNRVAVPYQSDYDCIDDNAIKSEIHSDFASIGYAPLSCSTNAVFHIRDEDPLNQGLSLVGTDCSVEENSYVISRCEPRSDIELLQAEHQLNLINQSDQYSEQLATQCQDRQQLHEQDFGVNYDVLTNFDSNVNMNIRPGVGSVITHGSVYAIQNSNHLPFLDVSHLRSQTSNEFHTVEPLSSDAIMSGHDNVMQVTADSELNNTMYAVNVPINQYDAVLGNGQMGWDIGAMDGQQCYQILTDNMEDGTTNSGILSSTGLNGTFAGYVGTSDVNGTLHLPEYDNNMSSFENDQLCWQEQVAWQSGSELSRLNTASVVVSADDGSYLEPDINNNCTMLHN